jgi:hypothetical protein
MQAQTDTRLCTHPRGETCHARRLNIADTTYPSDATGCRHKRTLPWAGILPGKHAMRVVLIMWIQRTDDLSDANGCRRNRTLPWARILPGKHVMRVVLTNRRAALPG